LLSELVPAIRKTADLVQEVAAASREQASGISQVNKAIGHMDQVTQRNAAAGEQLASTAEEVASQAESLQQLIAFFKVNGVGKVTIAASMRQREATMHPGAIGASPHAAALQSLMERHAASDPTSVDSEFQRF